VITALHALVYADDPEAARAFFRDVLGWPNIDAGGGWLIFRTGPSELGVHPTSGFRDDAPPIPERHEISLTCDDLRATMAELEGRGAEFSRGLEDQGFGLTAMLKVPGAGDILLYEPHHEVAHSL
jgi:catechol 2,3-dioxygenase-like lactoylglutathione lyase family enzyme